MWTLDEGVNAARLVQSFVVDLGAHAALSGSVLIKGSSVKDLDIVIYPHDSDNGYNVYAIQVALGAFFTGWFKCVSTSEYLRDGKEVWTTRLGEKRVDFFFLMSEGNKEL